MERIKIVIAIIFVFIVNLGFSQFYVDFNADRRTGCDSVTVHFTDATNTDNLVAWLWNFGDGGFSYDQNPVHTYLQPGEYNVELTVLRNNGSNPQQKNTTKVKFITVYTSPVASFTTNDSVYNTSFSVLCKSSTQLDTAGLTYIWNFGDTRSDTGSVVLHNYTAEGTYNVILTVTDNHGCSGDTTIPITIVSKFNVPNFFTPNNDGFNDEFIIESNGYCTYHFEVFDRWGNLLYEITARNIRWDGRNTAGLLLNPGVYYYVLTSKDDSKISKKNGCFEIFR
ncbi:MAG: PKD domain-containing protein [Bacteroidia bacterium]|nr:PKD domain-containing protein [Bacteroidia bacterium]